MVSPDKRDVIYQQFIMVYSNLIALQIILLTKEKPENLTSAKAKFVLRENVSPTDDFTFVTNLQ